MSNYTTVSDLYADVQLYMNRNEASIVNKIPLWVRMAEDELDRRLRHPATEAVLSYVVQQGSDRIPAPTNLAELKYLRIPELNRVLYRRSIETLYDLPVDDEFPTGFASVSNQYILNLAAPANTTFEYTFYMTPSKLSLANASSVYLVQCGDILLYLALSFGFAYDQNPEESNYWRGTAEQALAMLNEQIQRESMSGSTMVTFANRDFLQTYF